jgi:hypothetical protein
VRKKLAHYGLSQVPAAEEEEGEEK